jgi:hypothetical protein
VINAGPAAGNWRTAGETMEDFIAELDPARAPGAQRSQAAAASPWTFNSAGGPERTQVEEFIRLGFKTAYAARLGHLMPELMVLRHRSTIAAACGLRAAAADRLFLEMYLDAPVDAVLGAVSDPSVTRIDIIEVGNLVIARPGYARRLIVHLAACLYARGCRWVVFSAVPALRNGFQRIGIPLVTLARADADRLSAEERGRWGTYYDHSPVVTAVNVAAAFHAVCEAACNR